VAGRQQQLPGQPLGHAALVLEQIEYAVLEIVRIMPEVTRHRPVRIEIQHHDPLAGIGQQARQGDRRRGLAHSAFLIGYSPDSHTRSIRLRTRP